MDPYRYKGKVPVPILGMVDNILSISESGYKTCMLNAFLNAKTALKRLQFGQDKCHVLYVGKEIPNHKKIELFVDGWKMHELQDYYTGRTEIEETPSNAQEILESKQEKYLGQIISIDGTNVNKPEHQPIDAQWFS